MIRVLFYLLQCLPAGAARGLMRSLAWILWALGIRRRVALENLALAYPELPERERRAIARRNYLHLGACAADFLRSPALSDEQLFACIDPGDWGPAEPFLKERKGIIIATAHMGNFELFGVYAARRKAPLAVLTRELKGQANAQWVGTRTMAGIREIHRGYENLFQAVRNGEALALLIDQNMLLKRAVFAPFFGRLAATTPAPAVVAEKTGAPVFLGVMLCKPDGGYRTMVEGPFFYEQKGEDRQASILAFTAMLNQRFEQIVRAHPEQWFWLHRRWKTRPPEEAPARSEAPVAPAA